MFVENDVEFGTNGCCEVGDVVGDVHLLREQSFSEFTPNLIVMYICTSFCETTLSLDSVIVQYAVYTHGNLKSPVHIFSRVGSILVTRKFLKLKMFTF